MAKKSVDKMTKAELLREVKRLQKQYDKLHGEVMRRMEVPAPTPQPTWVPPWQKALTNAFEGAR